MLIFNKRSIQASNLLGQCHRLITWGGGGEIMYDIHILYNCTEDKVYFYCLYYFLFNFIMHQSMCVREVDALCYGAVSANTHTSQR